jgi:hypothetical protein
LRSAMRYVRPEDGAAFTKIGLVLLGMPTVTILGL